MNAFTELLKRKRKEAGLTQQQVADKMNVSIISVQNWESGKTKVSLSKLGDLAYLYNVPADELAHEMMREGNLGRKDNWPDFLFSEDANAIVRSLHLNLNQQDLFGLLYIYGSECLEKTMMDSGTLDAGLRAIPYEFIAKVGSIQFMNIAAGLQRVLQYVRTDYLMKVLRANPQEEFDVCRMSKALICEFIDSGHKEPDEGDFDLGDTSATGLYFHVRMNRAKEILPELAKGPIHIATEHWANKPILDNIPDAMLEVCGLRRDRIEEGYFKDKFNTSWLISGLSGLAELYAEEAEDGQDRIMLRITDKGRSLLEWMNDKE